MLYFQHTWGLYRCNVNKSDSPENVWHLETFVLLIWYGLEWHDNFLGETVKRNSQEGDVGISLSSLPLLDGSHLRQFVKHCMHHSTCVVMDCAAREWHEISRSDPPPLLEASLPPPWSHRKQFVTPSCAIDCVVYVLWVAWLEWPQKHDFVASSERGVCSTRSRRMTSPVYQSCLAFTLGSRQYQQGPIRLAPSDLFMQVWSLPGDATNHLAYV